MMKEAAELFLPTELTVEINCINLRMLTFKVKVDIARVEDGSMIKD